MNIARTGRALFLAAAGTALTPGLLQAQQPVSNPDLTPAFAGVMLTGNGCTYEQMNPDNFLRMARVITAPEKVTRHAGDKIYDIELKIGSILFTSQNGNEAFLYRPPDDSMAASEIKSLPGTSPETALKYLGVLGKLSEFSPELVNKCNQARAAHAALELELK